MCICFVGGAAVPSCRLVAVLNPATSKGAPFTATLTTRLGARVVDTSSQRVCQNVSLNANGSLTSCAVGSERVPCRLVSVIRPNCGCGIFRCRHSFLGTCRAVGRGKYLPILYKKANVCLRSMLGKCQLVPMPRGPRLEAQLTSGSLRALAKVLRRCGALRGSASMSAIGHTVQTVRVRRCCTGRPVTRQRFPRLGDLVVKMSVSQSLHQRGVDQQLERHLSRNVMSRMGRLLTRKVGTRSLVCCKLRCGFLALCTVKGLACRRVFTRLRATVRRFTGQRVA